MWQIPSKEPTWISAERSPYGVRRIYAISTISVKSFFVPAPSKLSATAGPICADSLGTFFLLTEGKASFFRYLPPFSASVYRLFLHLTACCFSGPNVEVIRISFIRLLRRSMSRPTTPEVSRRRWVLKTTIIAPSKACAARPGWCCQLFLFCR